jgi:hypothetical protein
VTSTERARDWRFLTEAAWGRSDLRGSSTSRRGERLSFDGHLDKRIARDWRVVFSDRLDLSWQHSPSTDDQVNTLKELYASWQARPDWILDLGRINTRQGVAYAYNPTDYFRAGATRSIVSIDPSSLRENRLGSVMARAQALWSDGSLSAHYSPKLADHPNDSAFDPDVGATNRRDRWLLAWSQRLTEKLNPQWLLYGEAGQSPQFGLNATALLNDATVGYVEWSGGRAPSLFASALAMPDDTAFRSRLAAGLTYTAPNKLSLTAEYQYNGTSLDRAGWDALRYGPPTRYAIYRAAAASAQDPPTRRRIFLRAFWQDMLVNHLDLTANCFFDAVDSSWQPWVEARYHWTRADVALQWRINRGSSGSEYGALPERQVWQAVATYFF